MMERGHNMRRENAGAALLFCGLKTDSKTARKERDKSGTKVGQKCPKRVQNKKSLRILYPLSRIFVPTLQNFVPTEKPQAGTKIKIVPFLSRILYPLNALKYNVLTLLGTKIQNFLYIQIYWKLGIKHTLVISETRKKIFSRIYMHIYTREDFGEF